MRERWETTVELDEESLQMKAFLSFSSCRERREKTASVFLWNALEHTRCDVLLGLGFLFSWRPVDAKTAQTWCLLLKLTRFPRQNSSCLVRLRPGWFALKRRFVQTKDISGNLQDKHRKWFSYLQLQPTPRQRVHRSL